jgi:uncharacterized protein
MRRGIAAIWLMLVVAPAALALERVDLFVLQAGGRLRFSVEIADDEVERGRGLMHRPALGENEGMLFLYPDLAPRAFWMKDTLIPLDILFLGADGTILAIAGDAKPMDETIIPSGLPAKAVLEIRGGLAEQLGINIGDRVEAEGLN